MTTPKLSDGERLEDHLKGEAKMLLKSVKAGNEEALFRAAFYFRQPEQATLQQVQLSNLGCDVALLRRELSALIEDDSKAAGLLNQQIITMMRAVAYLRDR